MIRNKQKMLLGVSILGLILFLGFPYNNKMIGLFATAELNEYYMGVPVVSKKFIEEQIHEKKEGNLEEGILFNYVSAPFDIDKQTLYIHQNPDKNEWEGIFSLNTELRNDYQLFFVEDPSFNDKSEAIRSGHGFTLYLIGEEYSKLNVIMSGVSVLYISELTELQQSEVDPDEDPDTYYLENQTRYIGEIIALSSDRDGIYQTLQSYLRYHLKGATSISYPKKSYAFTFVDEGGKDISLAIAGMSAYPDWKLNALYTDNTLLREKSALDIWSIIDRNNPDADNRSLDAEYVEVIINDSYVGTYLLLESYNKDKLGLDQNDILYKCINWNETDSEAIEQSIANKWKVQFPYRIRYPKNIKDYKVAWSPIKDFNTAFFGSGELNGVTLLERINIENVIDVSLFLEICALEDNNYKNLYYAAHVDEKGNYKMTVHPWDFDLSFGHKYAYEEEGSYLYNPEFTFRYDLRILRRLIEENPEIDDLQRKTYTDYRETILSDEQILKVLHGNWNKLHDSGAYQRNLELWELEHGDSDIETVIDFTETRLKYLDDVYKK